MPQWESSDFCQIQTSWGGGVPVAWPIHPPHANPLLSCFVSYCQTCAFFIVHHLPLLPGLTSREQGLFCFCELLSKRPVPSAVNPHWASVRLKYKSICIFRGVWQNNVVCGFLDQGAGTRSKKSIYGRKFSVKWSWTCFRTLIPAAWETEAGGSQVQGSAWVIEWVQGRQETRWNPVRKKKKGWGADQ